MSEVFKQSGEYKPIVMPGVDTTGGEFIPDYSEETDEERDARWKRYVADTERCIKDEIFDEAEQSGLRALEIAEAYGGDDQRLGISLELLSQIYYRDSRFHYGAPVMMRLLQMYRRRLGQDHLDTGTVTHNAALLYHGWRKVEEAGVFYQQAMYIKSAKLGLDHPQVEAIRDDYALYLKDIGEGGSKQQYKPLANENLSDAQGFNPNLLPERDRFTLSGQFDALPKDLFEDMSK
ncbi:MAG: tetratricopeptide repeat protein [Candidatus Melainabacteria bacterium]|nr:tetratricopeptide repeat protein [Candidatus Melainabacteria bacterium]